MSDRPTPETDDIALGNHVVPTEWAQQLERERDEAIEATKKTKAYKRVLKVTNAQLKRERDEARDKAERYRFEANAIMMQRDEARAELRDIRLNLGEDADGYTLLHAVCVIQNERDEAREALMKIEDLFIDGTDIYADRENMGMIAKTALEEIK